MLGIWRPMTSISRRDISIDDLPASFRRMYDTWLLMTRFLRSGQFDPTPVITHRFPLEAADEAIRAIKSGEAGKVIFEIA
jgi:threonine dehydrogenase-like Zn-dependent dehydrogenase